MRSGRTPEGRRFRELLNEGPVERAEMQLELERCVSHHRALAKEVTSMMRRDITNPYRSIEEQVASGKRAKAAYQITHAVRRGYVSETVDEHGKKWLSWA